jgi:hypothetical protein
MDVVAMTSLLLALAVLFGHTHGGARYYQHNMKALLRQAAESTQHLEATLAYTDPADKQRGGAICADEFAAEQYELLGATPPKLARKAHQHTLTAISLELMTCTILATGGQAPYRVPYLMNYLDTARHELTTAKKELS